MIRLTKTERDVLGRAIANPAGRLRAMVWHSTGGRGGIHGTRAAEAVRSLVRAGLACDLKSETRVSPNSDGWGSTHATEYVATLTEAGREAARSVFE